MKKDKEIREPCSPPQKKTGRKERQRNSRTNLQQDEKQGKRINSTTESQIYQQSDVHSATPICRYTQSNLVIFLI